MIRMEIDVPEAIATFSFPKALNDRLQHLLDRQDDGVELSQDEYAEAEGLVDLAEFLTILKMRARRLSQSVASE